MTIGWEELFTSVNERRGILEICVRTLSVTGNTFPRDTSITLAAITIRGTAAGWLFCHHNYILSFFDMRFCNI